MGQEGGSIRDPTRLDGQGAATAALGQVVVMAAIVATLLYFPLGAALALMLRVAGIAFETFATFDGVVGLFAGLVVWWLIVFAGALVYAACLFPWGEKVLGWPRKK